MTAIEAPIDEDAVLDESELLRRVRALGPTIDAASDEIDATRRLPDALVAALQRAGVIRMPMPKAWGGPELDPLAQIRVLEELSYHDGAAGWVAMICCDGGFYAAHLDESVGAALYPDLDVLTAGLLVPAGAAHETPGGFRVSGHWQFGSGILHSERVVGGCLRFRDGAPVRRPNGSPEMLVAFLPGEAVTIHDTWHTTGLHGTSSDDYSTTDVFVPEEHTFNAFEPGRRSEALYRYHGYVFTKLAAVPLGLLRRAIDETVRLADTKAYPPTFLPIKHEHRVQVAVASANADLDASWGLIERVIDESWATLDRGDELTELQRARLGSMIGWVTRTAKRAIDELCDEVGTAAAFSSNRLERVRRDATQISHHVQGQRKTMAIYGQFQLGLTPPFSPM